MGKRKRQSCGDHHPQLTVYRFTSDAHESKVVLARGLWSAVGLLLRWRAANELGEASFHVEPNWGSSLNELGRRHIDAAKARCREPSIAMFYRADEGWALGGPDVYDREDEA